MPIVTRYPATRKNRAAITVTLAGRSIGIRVPQFRRGNADPLVAH
jgi:hypothetical protein